MKLSLLTTAAQYCAIAFLIFFSSGCEKQESLQHPVNIQSSSTGNNRYFSADEHIISEAEAAEYIERFSETYPGMNTRMFFTKRALYEILAQPSSSQVRHYFGQSLDKKPELFLVAADDNNNDIITGDIISASSAELLSPRYGMIKWQDRQLIGLDEAAASTKRHRNAFLEETRAGTFSKDAIHLLLVKNPVFGVLVQYGLDEAMQWVVILRGLDKNGTINPGLIIERARLCPPSCGELNSLNSDI